MIEFIKKYGIGFLLSAIIMLPLSYVTATTIAARNITYNGANTNASLTNVQDAIEELYTMSEAKPIITFTIDGNTYQAEEGMTWGKWISSNYNTIGFKVGLYSETQVFTSDCKGVTYDNNYGNGVYTTETIKQGDVVITLSHEPTSPSCSAPTPVVPVG